MGKSPRSYGLLRFVTAAAFVALALAPRTSRADVVSVAPGSSDALDTLVHELDALFASRHVPAASVALVDRHGPRLVTAFGHADAARSKAATRDTPFRVASISKVLVALSVLTLSERGELSLSDTVASRLPSLRFENPWEASAPVRVVHLLEGTTGWDDLRPAWFVAKGDPDEPLLSLLARDTRARVSRWAPGSFAAYENSGATVAAALVEATAHTRYEAFVASRFFVPLGMHTATFTPSRTAAQAFSTRGAPLPLGDVAYRPSAGLAASADDMARLAGFLLTGHARDGAPLLGEASLARWERGETTPGARAGLVTAYGLASQAKLDGATVYRGHRGGLPGVAAELFVSRANGVGYFVALSNDDDDTLDEATKLVRAALAVPSKGAPEAPANHGDFQSLSGIYEPKSLRFERLRAAFSLRGLVRASWEGRTLTLRGLVARAPAEGAFHPGRERGTFVREGGHAVTLVARDDGALESAEVAMVKVGWPSLVARGLVMLALGVLVLDALASIVRALVFAARARRLVRPELTRLAPVLATVSLGGALGALALADASRLGVLGPHAFAILLGTTLVPVATAVTALSTVSSRTRLTRRELASRVAVIAALSAVSVHLAVHGALFVRTWD